MRPACLERRRALRVVLVQELRQRDGRDRCGVHILGKRWELRDAALLDHAERLTDSPALDVHLISDVVSQARNFNPLHSRRCRRKERYYVVYVFQPRVNLLGAVQILRGHQPHSSREISLKA